MGSHLGVHALEYAYHRHRGHAGTPGGLQYADAAGDGRVAGRAITSDPRETTESIGSGSRLGERGLGLAESPGSLQVPATHTSGRVAHHLRVVHDRTLPARRSDRPWRPRSVSLRSVLVVTRSYHWAPPYQIECIPWVLSQFCRPLAQMRDTPGASRSCRRPDTLWQVAVSSPRAADVVRLGPETSCQWFRNHL